MPREMRIACRDLTGHDHGLAVIDDLAGLVLVFPESAWAVLGPSEVWRLRAALFAHGADDDG